MPKDEGSLILPYVFAKDHGIIIIPHPNNSSNPPLLGHLPNASLESFAELNRLLACDYELLELTEASFQSYLAQIYQSTSSILDLSQGMDEHLDLGSLSAALPSAQDLLDTQDDAPIIRLINGLFTRAIKEKASDIHIETYENRLIIRNRIDGVLQEVLDLHRGLAPLVTSRIKVMAKLDIAEKRMPQDGRIGLKIGGHTIDVRVSTLPSNHGERIVLRILDKEAAQLDLNYLGLMPENRAKLAKIIKQPHGILLVTGPTGSGKTTSLYAMLNELNEVTRNILTIEDPIEYDLPGIGQTQVNPKINMNFARGLRAILRQDPDIVMIGEIRDAETAEIAVQASLTGHLVLSTLHTNSALGALTRLHDMGVESFLLSSSIIALIAQRLVRRLCDQCKIESQATLEESILFGIDPTDPPIIYKAKGCEDCHFLGYKGRTAIYEIIIIDEKLRTMIHRHESEAVMEAYIRPDVPSIAEDGLRHVLAGVTSLAEILRVTSQN